MQSRFVPTVVVCLIGFGCGEPADMDTAASTPAANQQTARPTPPRPPETKAVAQISEQNTDPTPPVDQTANVEAGESVDTGRVTAGEYLDAKHERREEDRYASNYVRTVVNAYTGFGIQDRVALDQAKKILFAYELQNGRKPRTHEEAMQALQGCPLPELDDGCKYVYDPKQGELMVEHPQ